jgi:hypothetical protein
MRNKLGLAFAVFVLLFSLVGFVRSQTPPHSKPNPTVASRAAAATSLSAAIFLAGPTRPAEQLGGDGTRGAEEHTPC